MRAAAISIRVFGILWLVLGIPLFLVSPEILVYLGFPNSEAFWTRLTGMLISFIGIYYIQASRHRSLWFFRATIWFRIVVAVVFVAFVAMGTGPLILIAIAAPAGLGAIWTLFVLRGARVELDIPERPTGLSLASPAERLTMHYIEHLVEKPEKNEGLLDEYVKGYRKLEEAIGSGEDRELSGHSEP